MNKKSNAYTIQKVSRHQNSSFKSYVNPSSCFSPSKSHSNHYFVVKGRRPYSFFSLTAIIKFLERNRILSKPKVDDMGSGIDSDDESTPRSKSNLQSDYLMLSAVFRDYFGQDNTKLAISTLGILLLHLLGNSLHQILFEDTHYGKDMHSFPPYMDFISFVNSVGACLFALLYFTFKRKSIRPKAPLTQYVSVGCCLSVAAVTAFLVEQRLSREVSQSTRGLVVLCIMLFQWAFFRLKFKRRNWVQVSAFSLACFFASVPWSSAPKSISPGPGAMATAWSISLSLLSILLFLLCASVGPSTQEKMFADFNMTVADQTLYIFLVVGAINLTSWLLGTHLGVIAGFVVDHPVIILSLTVSALPVAGKLYLMSYVLKLCGALTASMVHEVVMVAVGLAESGLFLTWESPFRWIGGVVMASILVSSLSGGRPRAPPQQAPCSHKDEETMDMLHIGFAEDQALANSEC